MNEAEKIKAKRQRLNMTQKEMADAVGLGKFGDRTIRRWEKGESTPNPLEVKAILNFPENPPFQNYDHAKYTMIDLFAGIGGTRLGFYQTRMVNTVFASEWNKFSKKTYYANFGQEPVGDITKIDEKSIPDHDILVAGFPCQAFSQAGKKLGFEDTRGTLFFDVARILKEKRPACFFLENVKNLKNHDHGRTFKIIMNTLKELNYSVHYALFKARDFGAPQNRERIYIVGFNRDKVQNANDFVFPIAPKPKTRVGDILEKKVDPKYTISDRLWAGHQRRKRENKLKGRGFGYSLVNKNTPYTHTLSARYYKDGSEILVEQKDKNPRKITPREVARLQGFPENFIIPVSDTQAYQEFGNSVCVLTVHAIAKKMVEFLDKNYQK